MALKMTVKTVTFEEYVQVHSMVVWSYAYRQARRGQWMENYLDNLRFRHKVDCIQPILSHILDVNHRLKIYNERFLINYE